MHDGVHLPRDVDEVRYVVFDEVEILATSQMGNVGQIAGHQVVDDDDFMPFGEKAITKVRSDKAGSARNEYSQAFLLHAGFH